MILVLEHSSGAKYAHEEIFLYRRAPFGPPDQFQTKMLNSVLTPGESVMKKSFSVIKKSFPVMKISLPVMKNRLLQS